MDRSRQRVGQTSRLRSTRRKRMADLVVVGFEDPHEADRALTELARL
jgi:hypothetical protein